MASRVSIPSSRPTSAAVSRPARHSSAARASSARVNRSLPSPERLAARSSGMEEMTFMRVVQHELGGHSFTVPGFRGLAASPCQPLMRWSSDQQHFGIRRLLLHQR